LFIAILSQTLGDVSLTRGMKSIGEVNTLNPVELFNIGLQVFTNPMIWLGILLLGIFFGLYLAALSWADLSFVLPITAFGYMLNAFMSWRLLGEHVSLARWIGTLIICVGVAVVSRTEQSTTRPESGGAAG
jgi:drug/metabolite transporter (DMT)-like permease